MASLDAIRTDVVGSLLRPAAWKEARLKLEAGLMATDEFARDRDRCVRDAPAAAGEHRPRRRQRRRGEPAQLPGQLRPRGARLRDRAAKRCAATRSAPPAARRSRAGTFPTSPARERRWCIAGPVVERLRLEHNVPLRGISPRRAARAQAGEGVADRPRPHHAALRPRTPQGGLPDGGRFRRRRGRRSSAA